MEDPDKPGERLYPWPDRLIDPAMKQGAIVWLRFQDVPSRTRRSLLQEWARVTGADVTAADYERVAGRSLREGD